MISIYTEIADKKTQPKTSKSEAKQEPERLKSLSGWGEERSLTEMQRAYGNQGMLGLLQTETNRSPVANPI